MNSNNTHGTPTHDIDIKAKIATEVAATQARYAPPMGIHVYRNEAHIVAGVVDEFWLPTETAVGGLVQGFAAVRIEPETTDEVRYLADAISELFGEGRVTDTTKPLKAEGDALVRKLRRRGEWRAEEVGGAFARRVAMLAENHARHGQAAVDTAAQLKDWVKAVAQEREAILGMGGLDASDLERGKGTTTCAAMCLRWTCSGRSPRPALSDASRPPEQSN